MAKKTEWRLVVPRALWRKVKTIADIVTLLMCKPGESVIAEAGERLALARPSGRSVSVAWLKRAIALPRKRWSKTAQAWLYPLWRGTSIIWVTVPES